MDKWNLRVWENFPSTVEVDVAAIDRCPARFYRDTSCLSPNAGPTVLRPQRAGHQDTPNILRELGKLSADALSASSPSPGIGDTFQSVSVPLLTPHLSRAPCRVAPRVAPLHFNASVYGLARCICLGLFAQSAVVTTDRYIAFC